MHTCLKRTWVCLAILALLGQCFVSMGPVNSVAAASFTITGVLSARWVERWHSEMELESAAVEYFITGEGGVKYQVYVDEAVADAASALVGQRVSVTGQQLANAIDSTTITGLTTGAEPQSPAAAALTGSRPWVTILCQYSDSSTVPFPASWFTGLMGDTYPGLNHFYQELSFDLLNIGGSTVAGWYQLAGDRAYYNGVATERAISECLAAGDPDVYFPNYYGINLIFGDAFTVCCSPFASGGIDARTLDGVSRTWGLTTSGTWNWGTNYDHWVLAHEMGHGFGLPHSAGPYGDPYDSAWDVMSGKCISCQPDATYGFIGQGTIAYHKDKLGWIPPERKYVAAFASDQTITLEQLEVLASENYLLAQVPITGTATEFYTVEARRWVGYDAVIPGEAVIIHKVDTTQHPQPGQAKVVDIDNNGNPNDAGAMWLPGETFVDALNGVVISVRSATATGFVVTIHWGAPLDKAIYLPVISR